MDPRKKLESDQKHYQDHDAHLVENDVIVRAIAMLVVTGFAIIGFFWFVDNAIVPLVQAISQIKHGGG